MRRHCVCHLVLAGSFATLHWSTANAQTGAALGDGVLPTIVITSLAAAPKRAQGVSRDAGVQNARRARRLQPAANPSTRPGVSSAQVATPGRGDISASVTALPAFTSVVDAATISREPVATYGDCFDRWPASTYRTSGRARSVTGFHCAVTPRPNMGEISPTLSAVYR